MASSSSSDPQETHQVFLSFFRGENTVKTFTSHLHAAFKRAEINTCIDYNVDRGDEISGTLLRAIEDAKLSVIVFSKIFATSKRCLEEVTKIIECSNTRGQIVVPIYYDVESTNVRNQTGSFASAFARHEQQFRAMGRHNVVQKWRDALAEAATRSAWDFSVDRMESELVEDIAADVLQKLDSMNSGDLERRIATYRKMAQQKQEKSMKSGNVRDMEDLIATMHQLGELKMEKALRTDDLSVWKDLLATYERISQLENEKFSSTLFSNLGQKEEELEAMSGTRQKIVQIKREYSNRKQGFSGI